MQKSNKLLLSREFLLEKISKNLNYLLNKTGITAKHLAQKTGIHNSLISKYKTGSALPPIDNLLTICRYFNVDVNNFATGDLGTPANMVSEPKEDYFSRHDMEKIELRSKIKDLEMALLRYVDDPEIIRKYIDDA